MRIEVVNPEAIGLECAAGRQFDLSSPRPHRRHPEIGVYTIVDNSEFNGAAIVSTWFEDGFIRHVGDVVPVSEGGGA